MRAIAMRRDRAAPEIEPLNTPDGAWVVLRGHWTAMDFGSRSAWHQTQRHLARWPARDDLGWDLRMVEGFDHLAAQRLWMHWGHRWPARLQMLPAQRALIERAEAFSQHLPGAVSSPWNARWLQMGQGVVHALGHGAHLIQLLGQLVIDGLRLLRSPRRGPWRDVGGHLYHMGASAMPITALVGMLIGVVLAYLMALQLRQFGAESFIVNILGISLIRELGPLLAAILVAGRSGSAITAQIGVMRVTEELDAMQVMGIPQGFRLVMPRALALGVAMPLLSVWTTLAALIGGILAADMTLGVSPAFFIQALPAAVDIGNLWLALAKSVVFGVLIALIGCHWGLRVEPNTQSLGAGTTASVVSAITMVIIVDAVFAVAFKNVGF